MKLNNKLNQRFARNLEFLSLPNTIKRWLPLRGGKARDFVTKILRSLREGDTEWDPWILKDGDVYRLFYLAGANEADPYHWWTTSKICSAISTDMKQWKNLGVILEPEPANAWESGRIFTGSTYKEDGVYYLFYSAGGKGWPEVLNEGIGLATSTDGLHWQRYSSDHFLKPDDCNPWYGWSEWQYAVDGEWRKQFQWRDPYIIKDHKTGKYYMFICAFLKEGEASKHTPHSPQYRGCIGVAVADKITGPYDLLPPAAAPAGDSAEEWPYHMMERPQVIYKDGKYHLFFSCYPWLLNPKWVEKVGEEKLTNSSLYWYFSDTITGPFKPVNEKPVIRGSEKTGMYGTHFFSAPDKPEEFLAYGWYHRLHILEVSPRFRVRWNDDSIEIR